MSNLTTIEEEIAKLESEQKKTQNKLNLLKKSKTAIIEQEQKDQKSAEIDKLNELVDSANRKLSETSIRFEHDQIFEAVLIKINDSHLSEYILTRDMDLKKISKFLDLFSRNVKTIEKIFDEFDMSSDYIRINYDDQKFKSLTFNILGRDEDIKIVAKDETCLTVKLTKGIEYKSDKVSVMSGGIEYSFYMVDSYDSFHVDATVSGHCSIDKFDETFKSLSKKLETAKIVEKD